MATTFVDYTGDGNATKAFSFPSIKEADVKVEVDGVVKTTSTHYNITSYTTTGGGNVVFTSGNIPANPAFIRIYRDTDVDTAKATYTAGSSVKAGDLNNNHEQLLFAAQEEQNQPIVTARIQNNAVTTAKIKDDNVTLAKLAGGALPTDITVATANIVDANVTAAKIAADAVNGTKIADDSINSEHYVDGSIDTAHIADAQITTAKIADGAITDAKITGGSLDNRYYTETELDAGQLDNRYYTEAELNGGQLNSLYFTESEITSGAADGRYYTETELDAGQLDNRYFTETELSAGALDGRYYTETEAEALFLRQDSTETIASGVTWASNDSKVATTAAIDLRIIDLVDDVGGFVAVANETSFPTANPDVNNGAGTIVSVKAASTNLAPSGTTVTIANGAGSGNTVTVTGVSATIPSGFGFLVETTTTLHTYTFHRLVPKATEVSTVAANAVNIAAAGANVTSIDSFADRYQISSSAPTTRADSSALAAGDLWFDSSSNKVMMVYDASSGDGFSPITPNQSDLTNINIVAGQITFSEDLGLITNAVNTGSGNNSVNTVGANIANVNLVGGSITNVNAVGPSIANVNTVAPSISNVNTLAGSINNVNTFVNVYSISANAPGSPSNGDLWYDSTNDVLKNYNGSAWLGITSNSGIASLADDSSPQLGGALDGQNNNMSNIGTIDGTNLQLDFGTIA